MPSWDALAGCGPLSGAGDGWSWTAQPLDADADAQSVTFAVHARALDDRTYLAGELAVRLEAGALRVDSDARAVGADERAAQDVLAAVAAELRRTVEPAGVPTREPRRVPRYALVLAALALLAALTRGLRRR